MGEHGRGAWPVSGAGGTLNAAGTEPGSYYCLAPPGVIKVGARVDAKDVNSRAVRAGVLALQLALNRRLPGNINITGVYDQATKLATQRFQEARMPGQSPWGGVGPDTAKALFLPDVRNRSQNSGWEDWRVVCGIIANESSYDPGAVGFVDPDDLGLAQINGRAHPDMSETQRFQPLPAIGFVANYLAKMMATFGNDERDAIAAFNLGAGGTRLWIKAGRPPSWTPAGATTPRNVDAYVDKILSACADS